MNVQRIVVADNQSLCRTGLASLLSQQFTVGEIVEASDFAHALAAIARAPHTSLVTVNMMLPSMNGVVGLRKLRADYPSLLLVVVAQSRSREQVLGTLCAGVNGYIVKESPIEEINGAFETILSGNIYVPPLVSEITSPDRAPAVVASTCGKLTRRQREIVKLVAAGLSNKEIARSLFIAEGTVKVHLAASFRALGVHSRVSAAAALRNQPRQANPSQSYLADLISDEPVTSHVAPPMQGAGPVNQFPMRS